MKKQEKELIYNSAVKCLQEYIKQGDTVFTVLNKVSSNGMSRHITPLVLHKFMDGTITIRNISYLMKDIGYKLSKDGSSVVMGGCGMDMGFHMVYNLSTALGYNTTKGNGENMVGNFYGLNHKWI